MRLSEALRFDAREPDKLGAVKTMATRLLMAADAIDRLERVLQLALKERDDLSRMLKKAEARRVARRQD